MKFPISIFLILMISGTTIAQELRVIEPKLDLELDFSEERQREFNSEEAFEKCAAVYEKLEKDGREGSQLTIAERRILDNCYETKGDVWAIQGGGCSWYCGGGFGELTASSTLTSQGDNDYEVTNSHDGRYNTAWVEGVPGYGTGESLTYLFPNGSPRVTKIIIVNGYVKSKRAYESNSRVKKLKMYVQGKPYAILNLKDVRAQQTFEVEPLGRFDNLEGEDDWALKFEIMEVYKGTKYDDVAITEIYFDGLDVHCFAKGTQVTMADGSLLNIEEIAVGDYVASFDLQTGKIISSRVEQIENVHHHDLVTYSLASGNSITATQDHPFWTETKGWASLAPTQSQQYQGFDDIRQVEIGDAFLSFNAEGEVVQDKLVEIFHSPQGQETYTLSKLETGSNFIANGNIVGVEKLQNLLAKGVK